MNMEYSVFKYWNFPDDFFLLVILTKNAQGKLVLKLSSDLPSEVKIFWVNGKTTSKEGLLQFLIILKGNFNCINLKYDNVKYCPVHISQ